MATYPMEIICAIFCIYFEPSPNVLECFQYTQVLCLCCGLQLTLDIFTRIKCNNVTAFPRRVESACAVIPSRRIKQNDKND